MKFYKYNGAGNDFLVADGREGRVHLDAEAISRLCDRHYGVGADGVMVLGSAAGGYDFTMEYFNSDGSGGMMCGNGGRCIVSFASFLGLTPSSPDGTWNFLAPDGPHRAAILRDEGLRKIVRLGMKDISVARKYASLPSLASCEAQLPVSAGSSSSDGKSSSLTPADGWFLDTGTRHFVRFVPEECLTDEFVSSEGRKLRWAEEFAPVGVNVNFVVKGNPLKVRTYEKGVEAETCACGTGITASVAAACLEGVAPSWAECGGKVLGYNVRALNDDLTVELAPTSAAEALACGGGKASSAEVSLASDASSPALFTSVWLTGPATLVAEVNVL